MIKITNIIDPYYFCSIIGELVVIQTHSDVNQRQKYGLISLLSGVPLRGVLNYLVALSVTVVINTANKCSNPFKQFAQPFD